MNIGKSAVLLACLIALAGPAGAQDAAAASVPAATASLPAAQLASPAAAQTIVGVASATLSPGSPAVTFPATQPATALNAADTAWVMIATALVLLMSLPGIALFYGGMVRRKNMLNTMASVVGIVALVSLLWFSVAYSLAFTPGSAWIGSLDRWALSGMHWGGEVVSVSPLAPKVPESVYVMFQLSFAVITAALLVGAVVERMRFSALMWFIAPWCVLVYAPVAHWVWEPGGWLARMGVLDFAGGAVVHINAGVAGLVCAYALGRRTGYGREAFEPVNLGLTMAGAAMLWIGWFGFNAGSALAADAKAGLAMLVTHLAACGGAVAWMAVEWVVRRRPSLLGLCSGVVAGLVAITPAAGFVTPASAILIGALAGLACYWGATGLKRLLMADDALDVFGVHAVGGVVGALLTGLLADPAVGGVRGDVWVQAIGALAVAVYSAVMTGLLLGFSHMMVGLRVDEQSEQTGLDIAQHRERVGP